MGKFKLYKRGGKWRKKGGQKASVAKVKKMIASNNRTYMELYYHDSINGVSVIDAGNTFRLTDVAQGDADTNRQGDKLTPKSLDMRFILNAETNSGACRIIIYRWKDLNAGVPGTANILQNAGGLPNNIVAPYVHDERDRFQVLYDKTITGSNNGREIVYLKKFLKLAKKPVQYTAASTTNAQDHLFLLVVGDGVLAGAPVLNSYVRFNYIG